MSTSELARLVADVETDAALAAALSEMAAASPEDLVVWAAARGYTITAEEATTLHEGELTEEDLEEVAGGWDGQGGGGG